MLKLSAVPTGLEILTSVPTDKSVGYFHLSLRDKMHIYKLGISATFYIVVAIHELPLHVRLKFLYIKLGIPAAFCLYVGQGFSLATV